MVFLYKIFACGASLPQAYKPLFFFSFSSISKVEILKEMINNLKKCNDTKLICLLNKEYFISC